MELGKSILLLGTAGAIFAAIPAAHAQDRDTQAYRLPAQPLGDALRAVARSGDRQLVADAATLEGRRAPALNGDFTLEDAVRALLAGSDMTAQFQGRTVIIRGRAQPPREEVAGAAADNPILVTGSRIKGAKVPAAVFTLGQTDIRRAGQPDLGEAIRSLPQNFSGGQNPGVAPGTVGLNNQNLTGGSSANLRGLGPDATLTLLNGHRLSYGSSIQAVDISAIPLAAVDRIEVVADGASAIYGSDAVGGVVNVILKRDYEGLSTMARFGEATDGGGDEQQYSLTAGHRWNAGGLLLAYDFSRSSAIDAVDRSYTRYMPSDATLVPWRRSHSALLSAHHEIIADTFISLDATYNHRVSESTLDYGGGLRYVNRPVVQTFSIAPSITTEVVPGWSMTLEGVYGKDRTEYDQRAFSGQTQTSRSYGCYCNTIKSVELTAQGSLAHLPAGDIRIAMGAGYRNNHFTYRATSLNRDIADGTIDSYYGYGELQVPLVAPEQDLPWADSLSLSGAVRYERYSRRSEVATPKVGIVYAPIRDLDIKGSWGKSFKVPRLSQQYQELSTTLYQASLLGGSAYPQGSTVMLYGGGNSELKPERATTWSAGFAFHPSAIPSFNLEVSYFNVRYRGRIIQPISGVNLYTALSDPAYSDYFLFNPSADEQAALIGGTGRPLANYSGIVYDPANVVAILDNTFINGARQAVSGIDATARYQISLADKGDLHLTGNASWLRSKEQISEDAAGTQLAGVIFNPPRLRARASLAWTVGGFSLSGYANYIGKLRDTRGAEKIRVNDQTTFDVSTSYTMAPDGLLGALDLGLSVRNLLNARPSYALPSGGYAYYVNYDSTNYSPVGRFVSVSVSKTW